MKETLAFHITALHREFLGYTTEELKKLGLSYGQMPLVLYTGKHPNCTQAELTHDLKLDWGYSQRCIAKLSENGIVQKEYDRPKSCNCLRLTQRGEKAFALCHSVFQSWDLMKTEGLTREERETLLALLQKLTAGQDFSHIE